MENKEVVVEMKENEKQIVIEQPDQRIDNSLAELKEPIFVGQCNKELLNKIDDLLDKDKFELAILPDSIQQSCRETYFFSKLSEKDRDNMLVMKKDKKLRQEGLDAVYQVEQMFKAFFEQEGIEKKEGEVITFKPHELKNVCHIFRRENLSNQNLRSMIEKMQVFGFITPTIVNEVYHKQEFAITIDYTDRLAALTAISNILDHEMQMTKARKELYDDEIIKISAQLSNDVKDADAAMKYDLTIEEQQTFNAVKMAITNYLQGKSAKVRLKEILSYCPARKQQSVVKDLKKLISLNLVMCQGSITKTYSFPEIN